MHDILDRINHQQRTRNRSSTLRKIQDHLLQPLEQPPKARLHHRRISQTARLEFERRRSQIYTAVRLVCRNLDRASGGEQRIRRDQAAEVEATNVKAGGVGVDVREKDNAGPFGRWSVRGVVWWGVRSHAAEGALHVVEVYETEVVVWVGYGAQARYGVCCQVIELWFRFLVSRVGNAIRGRPLNSLTVASSDMDVEVRLATSGAGSMVGVVMARFAIMAMGMSRCFIATVTDKYF